MIALDITCHATVALADSDDPALQCGHDIVDHELMGELSVCWVCEDYHHFREDPRWR